MKIIKTNITNIGDPYVLTAGGKYYLYATSSPDGFYVWTGKSLTNWSEPAYCYRKDENSFGYKDFWAPEVVERNGRYVMHYTACSKKTNTLRIGVAVSDCPEGPFTDVTPGEPMFDFGYAVIDGHVFTDGGKSYLYYAKDCSENVVSGIRTSQIYAVELSDDLLRVVGEPKFISTPVQPWETAASAEWRWNEGPFMLKHDGKYYLTYSGNCYTSPLYGVGYAVSDEPLGGFVKAEENPILQKIDNVISGPGHHCFFTDLNGQLMSAFHVHTHLNDPSGDRCACFCRVGFEGDKLRFDYREQA